MPFLVLTYIVQIGLIVHVMKTGRQPYWVFVLLMAPGIGALAYFLVEILPDLQHNMGARRAMRGVRRTLDPGGELRRRKSELKLSGSVDAARHLAAELVENQQYGEAIEHYRDALKGLYEHDPDLMLGLATAQFGDGRYDECIDTLDLLKEKNPEYKSADGHLLYARSLEQTGELSRAEEEYSVLAGYYPGVEARLRYAQLLERLSKPGQALEEYESILTAAELAPRHFRKAQKRWLAEARSGASRLK